MARNRRRSACASDGKQREPGAGRLPGHAAIVRPSEKSAEALERSGPQVVQAGIHNHNSTTVRSGFSSHPDAWAGQCPVLCAQTLRIGKGV